MYYAIAYLNMDGQGFSSTCPWVDDDINSIEQGCRRARNLSDDGYQNVTLFSYKDDEELPECITWDFVMCHKV